MLQIQFNAFDSFLGLSGCWSRDLYLDVVTDSAGLGAPASIVMRGRDKVLADAKPTTSIDENDRKAQTKLIERAKSGAGIWNDQAGASREYIVARGSLADCQCAAGQILDFYSTDDASAPASYSERIGALNEDARGLLLLIGAAMGSARKSSPSKVCAYSERATAKREAKRAEKDLSASADAIATRAAAAAATGAMSADESATLNALLAKLRASAK